MFSTELENLIEATLADGILEEREKAALVKRAQKEGVDLDELEIYIQSIMQKRIQNQRAQIDQETSAHEKERRGNICPHCGVQIPPMTKICPNCGQVVNANETSGDKELFKLIDEINAAIDELNALNPDTFERDKSKANGLIRKANAFYGENQKVQMLIYDLKEAVDAASKQMKSRNNSSFGKKILKVILWPYTIMFKLLNIKL